MLDPVRVMLSVLLGVCGALVIVYFLVHTPSDVLLGALARTARVLPWLLAIEAARIGCEAAGTRAMYAGRVPWWPCLRVHVLGYGLAFYLPAGRAASEAAKATLLARFATPARAFAVAAANQSIALLGLALAACVTALGACFTGAGATLCRALFALSAITFVLSVIVRVGTRRALPAARSDAFVPLPLLAAFTANRALQFVSIALLLSAVGGRVNAAGVFAGNGLQLVGASLGDVVPGQLGTVDASFAFGASFIGLDTGGAVAMALTIHVVQLAWLAAGLVLEGAARLEARPERL